MTLAVQELLYAKKHVTSESDAGVIDKKEDCQQ